MVWVRVSQPSRVRVEFSTTESFKQVLGSVFADALPESDLTMKVGTEGLPSGQNIFYRVTPQNHADPSVLGEQMVGHVRTAPADSRDVTFVWSGDMVGQGWGMNEDWGGIKLYADGFQFFGHVEVDGKTRQLTVTLRDGADAALWATTIDPVRA